MAAAVARTSLGLLSAQGVTWTSALINILVVPRFLGASNFGLFATAIVVNEIASTIAVFGADNFIVRAAARDPGRTGKLVGASITVRLLIWFALVGPIVLALFAFSSNSTLQWLYLITLGGGAAGLVHRANIAGLQANFRLAKPAIFSASLGFVSQVTTIAILAAGGGVVAIVASSAIFRAVIAGVSSLFVLRFAGMYFKPSIGEIRSLLESGRSFLAWDLALLLFSRVDILMLTVLATSTVVGTYSFAYRMLGFPGILFTIVVSGVYPALAAMSQNDREWVKAAISNTGRLVVVTAMPMAAGIALISNDIVSLFGGDSFDQASMLVCILAAHIPLAALGTVLGAGLWALDRQRAWAVTAWCAVALNIGGNAIAIPVASAVAGQPAAGAALVTIATEAFMLARAWALIGEAVDRPMLLRAGTGAGFSCAIMAVIVLSLPPGAPLAAIVAIGAATYAVAILASRTVQFSDARFVARAIAQRQVSAQAA